MARGGDGLELNQVSAETREQFARELADKVMKKLQRKSRRAEWAKKLEAAALQGAAEQAESLGNEGKTAATKLKEKVKKHRKHKSKHKKRKKVASSCSADSDSEGSDESSPRKHKKKKRKHKHKHKQKEGKVHKSCGRRRSPSSSTSTLDSEGER